MNDTPKRQLEKKAYEIAYALFRISGNLNARPLSGYIENHCLSLFDSAIYGNKEAALKESKILEYYLRLGGDTGLIHSDNVEMLILEIGKLNSAIAELKPESASSEPLKLSFSTMAQAAQKEPKVAVDIQKKEITPEVINKELEAITNTEAEEAATEPAEIRQSPTQAEIRQSAIADKIRQFGICRMKEIQEAFSNVSERTLRYDLEKLVQSGLVERIGQSGPATSYRARITAFAGLPIAKI